MISDCLGGYVRVSACSLWGDLHGEKGTYCRMLRRVRQYAYTRISSTWQRTLLGRIRISPASPLPHSSPASYNRTRHPHLLAPAFAVRVVLLLFVAVEIHDRIPGMLFILKPIYRLTFASSPPAMDMNIDKRASDLRRAPDEGPSNSLG